MDYPDPLLEYTLEEKPPPNPALSALKRALWIIITLIVILSLLTSMLLPLLLSRRDPPRRDLENDIQAHLISNLHLHDLFHHQAHQIFNLGSLCATLCILRSNCSGYGRGTPEKKVCVGVYTPRTPFFRAISTLG
ncbi:MAG TPA: hypothetical protein VI451_03700 [Anaerolineales bacterium]|nr:hypothetical protein [Anaerolineales bacterium]